MVSGAAAFVFGFFDYAGEGPFAQNAWDEFPLFISGALFGGIAAAAVLLSKLGGVQLPNQVLGFGWNQIHLALALFAFFNTVGLYLAFEDVEIGLLVGLLGSIGLIVGAVMMQQERRSSGPSYCDRASGLTLRVRGDRVPRPRDRQPHRRRVLDVVERARLRVRGALLFVLAGAAVLVGIRGATTVAQPVRLALGLLAITSTLVVLVTGVGSVFGGIIAVLAALGLVAGATRSP